MTHNYSGYCYDCTSNDRRFTGSLEEIRQWTTNHRTCKSVDVSDNNEVVFQKRNGHIQTNKLVEMQKPLDRRENIVSANNCAHAHYTLQWVLNVIHQLREANTPVDMGAVRFLLGVNAGVSDDFINCAIRFEQEIQGIAAKEVATEKAAYDAWLTEEMKGL